MNAENDIKICISPRQGKITIEEQEGLVTTRKEIDRQALLSCFKNSLRTEDPGYSSGFLPLNCLSVWQGREGKRFVLWHPKLYADMTLYDTPYSHFPIPRMVFRFSTNAEGKVSDCRIGVVADETPTPDSEQIHSPLASQVGGAQRNVSHGKRERVQLNRECPRRYRNEMKAGICSCLSPCFSSG